MNARFAPIFHASPLAHPAPTCIPAPRPQILEEAIVQPDYEGMDDTAAWAQTYRPANPADPDDVFSQDEDAEEAVMRSVCDGDTLKALEWLHANKVLPDHVWHVINETSMAMAEKRLNRSQA